MWKIRYNKGRPIAPQLGPLHENVLILRQKPRFSVAPPFACNGGRDARNNVRYRG
jgi:hypothetical protein